MANEKSVVAVIRAARPSFRNNNDKAAFALHASFLSAGYVLTANGPSAFAEDALSSPSTDEVGIEHWNELDDEYAFVYIDPEKGGKKVLVKCLAMNGKLLVDALADGASQPAHLEIDVGKYVRENGGSNYSTQFENLGDFVKAVDAEILSKLYDSPPAAGSGSSNAGSSLSKTRDSRRPELIEPDVEVPGPPGPYIHPSGVVIPPVNSRFGDDLNPGPGAGMYPRRDFGYGGDLLLGPNDPRWFGGIRGGPGFPGGEMGVPPGARFDPYGPPGVPGFQPNRFRRPSRGPGNTHPDLEQPGSGSFDYI